MELVVLVGTWRSSERWERIDTGDLGIEVVAAAAEVVERRRGLWRMALRNWDLRWWVSLVAMLVLFPFSRESDGKFGKIYSYGFRGFGVCIRGIPGKRRSLIGMAVYDSKSFEDYFLFTIIFLQSYVL